MLHTRKVLATLLSCLFSQTLYAADAASETDYFQDFPVVLSASRLSQPLSEAPNAMTVIDRKMIKASGFRSIPDLFKLVPGMYVSYYKGSQAIVSYHGSSDQYARRMQVLIDGRSVYMPPASTVDWANLPITIDDIERIEVIRGPAAASHGANSTQGVISITTRDAGAIHGRQLSITRGEKGINDVAARYGHQGETLDYRLTMAYSADNGYDNLTAPPNNMTPALAAAGGLLNNSNDSNQARMLNYRADYHPNGVDRFDIQFGFNRDVQTAGWTDSFGNPNHDLISNSNFAQLGWIRALDNNDEFSVRYSHMGQQQSEFFTVMAPSNNTTQTKRDEIELQHTVHLTESNRLVYGAAWRRDQVSGQGDAQALLLYGASPIYSSSLSTNEYRFFAHDEWRITQQLLLNTGAMLERDGLGHENLSPRVAVNYHVTPQHTVRMGASVAYRTPALAELHYRLLNPGVLLVPNQTITSPGLIPEKMLSREIGYLGEFPTLATSLDLRVFNDQLGQGIYLGATQFENGYTAAYKGIEATVKHAMGDNSDLTVNFAHELARSNAVAVALSGVGDVQATSTPLNSASLLYTRRFSHDVNFSTAYYYQDALQPYMRNTVDHQPMQRRTDMRLAKVFNQGGGVNGELALVLQNVFDIKYSEYVANNVFNRRSYVTLTLNW
ncbi:MAG: TonB-dependent receptor [Nitrosomonadales bacterium]